MSATPETGEKLATFEEYAAIEFEAWKHVEGEWEPPSTEEWAKLENPHLITIRIAWVMLHKTKPELMEVFRSMEEAGVLEETMDRLQATNNFLKGLLLIIEGAQSRFIGSGAALVQNEGGAGQ